MTTRWPNNEPIYYVVVETAPRVDGFPIYAILRVIECDFSDAQQMWETHVAPLYSAGRRVQSLIFHREPDNPFREAKQDATHDASSGNNRSRSE